MVTLIQLEDVRDLGALLNMLSSKGYKIEAGPHAVLEDHSEIASFKGFRNGELAFVLVAHYISQYYRVIASGEYTSDEEFLEKLLRVKYSGEEWSIPVNPVFIAVFQDDVARDLEGYSDAYPVPDGEVLVKKYREANPYYRDIQRTIVARLADEYLGLGSG